MINYGLMMSGPLVIERVEILPSWSTDYIGRMLYDLVDNNYWIGGNEITDGVGGWIQFGLNHDSVRSNYIMWDDGLDNPLAISSEDIPTLYRDTTSNVQLSLTAITDNIDSIVNGSLLDDDIIKERHIGFDTQHIQVANVLGKFDSSLETVEQVLNFLSFNTADRVFFADPHDFGIGIGSNADDVQTALLDIDQHLNNLNADQVKALIPGTSVWSSVQSVLEMINSNLENLSFTDLVGTPDNYGNQHQVLLTNGTTSTYFADLYASGVLCQYPGTTSNTVQGALTIIQVQLDALAGGELNLDASDISYDDSPSVGFNNVDDVLDYLLTNSYSPSNPPDASVVTCSGIGVTNNVQAALEFLQAEIESCCAGQSSECGSPIAPVSVHIDAEVTLAGVGQDYLLLNHTYGGVNEAPAYVTARIVISESSQDQDINVRIDGIDTLTINKALLYPGYTIFLAGKVTIQPNQSISVYASSTAEGCGDLKIGKCRMLIEPSL